MRSYEDLTFYQDMYALTREIYRALPAFPADERFGLAIQIRSSSVSYLSNIAEGSGRGTDGEYANSVSNACGSGAELDCQLKLSRDLGFLPAELVKGWLLRLDSIRRRTRRFYETLKNSATARKPRRPRGAPSEQPPSSTAPGRRQSPPSANARPKPNAQRPKPNAASKVRPTA